MPRHCALTGTKVQYGNRVSHSHRKSNRRFEANLQRVSLLSHALGHPVRLLVSCRALRTVEKKGGLDGFLLGTDDRKLAPEAVTLKKRVRKALARPKKKPAVEAAS